MTLKAFPDRSVLPAHTGDYADLLVEYLKILGVDYVFGVPGGAIEPFYNALARHRGKGGPQPVVARHEAGAAFMAEGYARETGRLGVCCATTGPGTTNLLTGVASAHADNVPMLVISAQTPLPKFGRNALQESSCTAIDTVSIFRSCTRYNTLISHPEQVNNKVISAIMAAFRTPHGPAHISIPSDVLRAVVYRDFSIANDRLLQRFNLTDNYALKALTDQVAQVRKIALFLGRGCEGAMKSIEAFARHTHAVIITGPAGKRWISAYHPQFRGIYGFAGHQAADAVMNDPSVDMIIAVGTALSEIATAGWDTNLLSERLVHIDASVEHFSRSSMAQLHVCGDVGTIFRQLLTNLRRFGTRDYPVLPGDTDTPGLHFTLENAEQCEASVEPLLPQRVTTVFARTIPPDFRVLVDAGNAWAWFTHYFHRDVGHEHYHIAMGIGSMGWAIGAAVGVCLGSGKPAVCVTGDGSYLMSGQEITVALQHAIPVIIVVLNDAALGMVKHGQRMGGAEAVGFELPPVNFALMAESMGIEGIRVTTDAQLQAIDWERLGAKASPTLIDVLIDGESVPPMAQRVKGLATQSGSSRDATPT